jgi:large subunit ribosomal protein L25
MAENELKVAVRSVTGKKVAQLRRAGQTPANVYGHRIDSTSVQVGTPELTHMLKVTGRNALIELSIEGEGSARTVMVRDIARNPLNGKVLHVDFYQVNMTEKMKADVPVILTGTSEAVLTYGGVLLQMVDVIHVEALPADLPSEFTVDVSVMTELEQSVHVRDLHLDTDKVTILSDPDIVLARVAAPRLATEEEEAAAAAPGEEGAEGEAAAGEAPAEGASEESE